MHLTPASGLGRALEKFRPLCGKRVALLDANGLYIPRLCALKDAFELAGAEAIVVAPTKELRQLRDGSVIVADVCLADTAAEVYHALCIPGAPAAVVALRNSKDASEFLRNFARSGKWIATLDNGPLLLEDLGLAAGKTLTSEPSLRAELEQAGAEWSSEPAIGDHPLVTARGDEHLEAFLRVATLSFQSKPSSSTPPGFH